MTYWLDLIGDFWSFWSVSILQWCSCRDYINTYHFHRSHERCRCHHFCEGWMCKPCRRRVVGSPDMALDGIWYWYWGTQPRHECWWIRYVFECFLGHSGNLVREVSTTSWVEFVYREEAFDVRLSGAMVNFFELTLSCIDKGMATIGRPTCRRELYIRRFTETENNGDSLLHCCFRLASCLVTEYILAVQKTMKLSNQN